MRDEKGRFVKGYKGFWLGKKNPHSEETKKKIGESNMGRIAWNKGISHSEETKKKISKNLKGKNIGEKNGMWKGDKVGIVAIHAWVKRNKLKIEICECCNKKPTYDLANISGEYKRDIKDWEWLCRGCHMKKDGRLKKLHKNLREKRIGLK